METTVPIQYFIPDFVANFPWPRQLNKNYLEVEAETTDWTDSYHLFEEESLKAGHHVYFEVVRIMSKIFVIFFVIDELSDRGGGEEAIKIHDIVMGALRNPHKARPQAEHKLGELTRESWVQALEYLSPDAPCIKRFIDGFENYMTAVIAEANDRTNSQYRNFEEYLVLRRNTSGTILSFVVVEFGLDIPDEVYNHPRVQALLQNGADLIIFVNDLLSYAREKVQSGGTAFHNSIELLMVEKQLEIQAAINELERRAAEVLSAFVCNRENLPSWGEEIDRRVKIYADGIAYFVRANEAWSFETCRYFGTKGLEIQKTRIVTLSPPGSVDTCPVL
ncbi:hypothetical protein GALMADRAFT_78470 [Galerina marginata CBS 339.88]|uniref:Terpene synthase n=1 Tax=Galerina marginata (strain CBS 339.88) TaxID=685588 RepID=A0A067SC48_GALM3|nr:hypothetical protein GALMADRAFT_78470 [Galerina marginata CBS 339.88]